MATFESSLKPRLIYVFAINDKQHKDCLKIGETTLEEDCTNILPPNDNLLNAAAHKRIDQYTKTAGIDYQLLYTEMTLFLKDMKLTSFNDKEVHNVLMRSGIKKKVFDTVKGANEWFCCDLETAKKAIIAVKEGKKSLMPGDISESQNPIIFRPEQRTAIEKTIKQFKKGNQMLWNAKMRFGKTLSALEVVKRCGFARTIIVTHRPVVDKGWFEDFNKIFYDRSDYHYGSASQGETFGNLEKLAAKGHKFVYFASMQDLRGSSLVGGKFEKNQAIFDTPWDLLIVDEAHEGTQTELGKSVTQELTKKNTKVIRLSGTPFNLLDDYSEDEIFTWDYVMEQRAKAEWDEIHMGDPNPYESLPAINIYTYDLGSLMSDFVEDERAFNFREFFRTRSLTPDPSPMGEGSIYLQGDNSVAGLSTPLPTGGGVGGEAFIHDNDVDRFLDLLCKDDAGSLYPYSRDEFRKIFRHTLWVVPGVKAARALSAKLKAHAVFGNFQVVNVAGNGDEDEENTEALKMVNDAIGPDPGETFTITLSCGRLTTGVSVKPWTAVFMMAGSFSTSAAQYMQTIFRVQTPFTCHGRMKDQCYAFDFAPDRTLRVLAEAAKVSAKAGKQTDEDRRILGDFLNFCPIISIEGSRMDKYDVEKMMGQLKKAQIERVVQCGFEDGALYNDELLKLTEVDLKDFDHLKGIIGKTKAMAKTGDIDVNKQGFTNEEYEEKEQLEKKKKKDLTPEEQKRLEELKKKQTQRKDAISILRGISIRMPLLIYGAELKEQREQSGTRSSSAESRLKSTEGQLKEEEITIDNFASLIDAQSWEEFMPKDVTKAVFNRFKKYYDPDIFREAGKRIRAMARAADKFTIEERIERITAIFNTFRNPDKETVLTPWRVVNMHLSDCLGGWCFYDEEFKHTLQTPRWVEVVGHASERADVVVGHASERADVVVGHASERADADGTATLGSVAHYSVTQEVFRPEAHILEINSKSGLYPLYVAYSIYRSRVEAMKQKYGNVGIAFAWSLWDATIAENILVVCKTPMARSITRRTLSGFRNTRVNAQYYKDLIKNISEKPDAVVNTFRDGKHFWKINQNENMKLDAIVGNPPYQMMDGGTDRGAVPVYQHFVEIAKKCKPNYISMIMPARWYAGGRGLDDFRESMLSDKRIQYLYDFETSKDLFPTVDIAGGLCYFLWHKLNVAPCKVYNVNPLGSYCAERYLNEFPVFVRSNTSIPILKKVTDQSTEYLNNLVLSINPFGFRTYFRGRTEKRDGDIKILTSEGWGYVSHSEITKGIVNVNKYKIIVGRFVPSNGELNVNPHCRRICT